MTTMNAGERWAALVRARLAEMERLRPGHDVTAARFWDSRARRFAARMSLDAAATDPFVRRVRRSLGRRSTVLDVGAGPGRFALTLAPHVAEVTAVDASAAMLRLLRAQARSRGIANVRCVEGRWEEVEVPPADVAFASYVLPLVEDAPRFLAKLTAAARRRAFLYLGALPGDALFDALWRHFHGAPRQPAPTYLDAVAVLRELGLSPQVQVVEVPSRTRFDTVAEAVKEYGDYLLLPATRPVRRELHGLLESWLVRRDGHLCPPVRSLPAAVVGWAPASPA